MSVLRKILSFPLKTTLFLVLASYVIVKYQPPTDAPDEPKELTVDFGMNAEQLETAEFYPLSSFRMYSKFSPKPNYVYITDGEDKPIAHQRFGKSVLSSAMKKDFDRRLRKIKAETGIAMRDMTPEIKWPAGNETLQQVVDMSDPGNVEKIGAKTLRLYEVALRLKEEGGVDDSDVNLVGEISL